MLMFYNKIFLMFLSLTIIYKKKLSIRDIYLKNTLTKCSQNCTMSGLQMNIQGHILHYDFFLFTILLLGSTC